MPYKGEFGLTYENAQEERHFIQTRRLNGFHCSVVQEYFEEESYKSIKGGNWNEPEPKGRGNIGNWGMDLRYACLDHWYRDQAIEGGRFSRDEVDNFWAAWKGMCKAERAPLSHEVLLEHWRSNRKDRREAGVANKAKKERRRTKSWQAKFQAERDPNLIYRRLRATLPVTGTMDEQVLRSFARMLAEANDLLWQAEQIKFEDGIVPEEKIADYAKLLDLVNKIQKQVSDLLKSHGYDYQARRARRESQTAAEILDDVTDDAVVLFDSRAAMIVCGECNLEMAYIIRQFPTVQFTVSTVCPKCDARISHVMEPMVDEVMSVF